MSSAPTPKLDDKEGAADAEPEAKVATEAGKSDEKNAAGEAEVEAATEENENEDEAAEEGKDEEDTSDGAMVGVETEEKEEGDDGEGAKTEAATEDKDEEIASDEAKDETELKQVKEKDAETKPSAPEEDQGADENKIVGNGSSTPGNMDEVIDLLASDSSVDGTSDNQVKTQIKKRGSFNNIPNELQLNRWKRELQDLKAYKAKFGHVNVSQSGEYSALGKVVMRLRRQYKAFMSGDTSPLTNERIEELEKIGFQWTARVFKSPFKSPQASAKKYSPAPKTPTQKTPTPKKRGRPPKEDESAPSTEKRNKRRRMKLGKVYSKLLSDGTQLVESKQKATLPDGSTVETVTEELIKKRVVTRDDGTRVLETTKKTILTTTELVILPPEDNRSLKAPPEAVAGQTKESGDELQRNDTPVTPSTISPEAAEVANMSVEVVKSQSTPTKKSTPDKIYSIPSQPAEGFPDGWTVRVVPRSNNEGTKKDDSYWFSPKEGYKFRSRKEVERFLDAMNDCNGDESAAMTKIREMKKP